MSVSDEKFRSTLAHFASGVNVVTCNHEGQLSGLTVSAFCSVSLDPPYILICVDKQSTTNRSIQNANAFAVNILHTEQVGLSNNFARRAPDKFANVKYHLGPMGQPLLDGVLGTLECSVAQTVDAGDHYVYIGLVEDAQSESNVQPLVYYAGNYHQLTGL